MLIDLYIIDRNVTGTRGHYPRQSRSAIDVDIGFTLDVCMFVCLYVCMYVSALERKRLIGMT